MYFYFYKTKNLVNGKFYYGVHKTYNLNDGYLGSGKRIKYAIKKYGIYNFKKEILLFFENFDDALEYESQFVDENLVLDPNCYNIKNGGLGGWDYVNNNEEIINKKGKNISKKLKSLYKEGLIIPAGWNNKNNKKGRKLSQHTKQLISKNNGNSLSKEEYELRMDDLKNIEKKRGWITQLSKKWKVSHTQVKRFIKN